MRRGRPPYPELLTPREQEVLALLREGLTNPQIAERLGVSRAGAAYHVSEILSKLQVSSREEAAAWRPEVEGASSRRRRVPMPAFLASALQRFGGEKLVRVAAGAVIGASIIGLALLAFGVVEMSSREGTPADPTAEARAPQPTTDPEQDGPLTAIDDGFERRTVAPDEMPDVDYGILFVDVDSGAGELWTVFPQPAQGEHYLRYWVDESHRWLFRANLWDAPPGRSSLRTIIADRETGESFALNAETWRLDAGPTPEGLLVLRKADLPDYRVVDLANDPAGALLEFSLPGDAPVTGVFLGGGQRLLVGEHLVELATGEVRHMPALSPLDGGPAALSTPFSIAGGGALVGERILEPAGQQAIERRLVATGEVAGMRVLSGVWPHVSFPGRPSPDGRWLALQASLPLSSPGMTNFWPAVVLVDLETGEAALRAVRASLSTGANQLQWLGDSSGVVVATPSGFAVLAIDGSLHDLDFAPVTTPNDPLPVPVRGEHDPSLFVYAGRLIQWGNEHLGADFAAAGWGRELWREYGLGNEGDELHIVSFIPAGKDFTLPVLSEHGLPATVERQPFPEAVRVRVNSDGDSLNVRALPGDEEEIVGLLADEAVVTVTDAPGAEECAAGGRGPGCSVAWEMEYEDPDVAFWVFEAPLWLHVRTDDGLEGWVSAAFLAWP